MGLHDIIRQKANFISSIVRRGVGLNLYGADDPTAAELVADLDHTLFRSVLHNVHHVLHHILPDRTSLAYSLRPR